MNENFTENSSIPILTKKQILEKIKEFAYYHDEGEGRKKTGI